jgi:hypothetical protein
MLTARGQSMYDGAHLWKHRTGPNLKYYQRGALLYAKRCSLRHS